ncbi:MAG TPA: hypothetical protein VNT54_02220 [Solirubrobacteraceae bacterium]|nr:hypothetical protein [Solirubrobacteraceae bacterium]
MGLHALGLRYAGDASGAARINRSGGSGPGDHTSGRRRSGARDCSSSPGCRAGTGGFRAGSGCNAGADRDGHDERRGSRPHRRHPLDERRPHDGSEPGSHGCSGHLARERLDRRRRPSGRPVGVRELDGSDPLQHLGTGAEQGEGSCQGSCEAAEHPGELDA